MLQFIVFPYGNILQPDVSGILLAYISFLAIVENQRLFIYVSSNFFCFWSANLLVFCLGCLLFPCKESSIGVLYITSGHGSIVKKIHKDPKRKFFDLPKSQPGKQILEFIYNLAPCADTVM